MSVVFADAFYFVARLNRRDQHHERVLQFSRDFRARLLTSDWVLMEVADALAESECRGRVREFIPIHPASTPVPGLRNCFGFARIA